MANKFQKKVLKNGMTILFEKRDLPIVSVAYGIRCGGINESSEEKGISHLIEHMLYKGTPTRNAKKIAEEIEKNGGDLNGFTDEELTAYWVKMPSKHLDVALEVLTDMVKNPLFDEKELEKEKKVIFEEIKMRRDDPRTFIFDEIQAYLYGKPFGEDLIGTQKTLNSMNRESLSKKFKEIYTPNNLILCVVGDAKFEDLISFAERNFGDEKGEVPEFEIKLSNQTKIVKRKGIDQANSVLAFHLPREDSKKNYSAKVLLTHLGGGMSSILFSEIREKRNLAYSISAHQMIRNRFSYGMIYMGTAPEKVDECKKLVLEEFEKVSKNFTQKELDEVKEQMIGNYHIYMEDSQSQMASLLLEEINGNAKEFYDFEKNIRLVGIEEVKELAKLKDYSFLSLIPEK